MSGLNASVTLGQVVEILESSASHQMHIGALKDELGRRGIEVASRIELREILYSPLASGLVEPTEDPANGNWRLCDTAAHTKPQKIELSETASAKFRDSGFTCPTCNAVLEAWSEKPAGPRAPGTRWACCGAGCTPTATDPFPKCFIPGCERTMSADTTIRHEPEFAAVWVCDEHSTFR